MKSLLRFLRRFASDESGPAVVEYVVMLGLVTLAVLMAVTNLGQSTSGVYNNVSSRIGSLGDGGESSPEPTPEPTPSPEPSPEGGEGG